MTMFGYTAADFDGTITAFNRRLHPDDLTRVSEALRACIDLVGDFEAEYRVVRPDGETRWVQARGRALAGAGGRRPPPPRAAGHPPPHPPPHPRPPPRLQGPPPRRPPLP